MAEPVETYVVMGLARSGLAAARRLLDEGAAVRATDIKPRPQLETEAAALEAADGGAGRLTLTLGEHPSGLLDGARAVILSPGIPLTVPFLAEASRRGIPVWSEVEFAFRRLKGVLVGITGSNGKSTTTALTAHVLANAGRRAVAAGNIGTPLSEFIPEDAPEAVYVTELSSFQLESVDTFRPRIGAILNITPDHLDRYPSMAEYEEAKWNLFRNMAEGDAAVLNARDGRLAEGVVRLEGPVYWFDARPAVPKDLLKGAGVYDHHIWLNTDGRPVCLMGVDEVPLPGPHNLENALAAAVMARLLGLDDARVREGIRSFRALEHRLEPVAEIAGRLFVNDSKATNVDSTLLALKSYRRPLVLILGGKDKGSPYTPLLEPIRKGVRHCLLIGKAAPLIAEALGPGLPHSFCETLEEATRRAFALSEPGDAVVLSPACASYDMFDNFEHRGRVFKETVRALEGENDGSGGKTP
ncbi:MAG: UDP-N-acetylmuramoyl-L-alanine--D-glutamate ligase [Acidobacteria bacterium]|nr:UDP-N-acetylmuramoyl-L-alanine--D-glutamate ligase [Acidobacteriota bacterium]